MILAIAIISGLTTMAQLPDPGFVIDEHTAIVITDPQIDFLSEKGVTWGVVGKSVVENNTVAHLEQVFQAAKEDNMLVFISPHYYYEHDHKWEFEGALETLMHKINMFQRKGPLDMEGFENSGADWMPQYKKYISGDNIIVTNPHKVYGPESNDLALQMRKRGINKVILAGMSANLCVESHMRELLEEGFEVAIVTDATAAAKLPGLDAYSAALVNFRMMASHLFTTEEIVKELKKK